MPSPLISATDLHTVLAHDPGDVTVLEVRYRMGGPPGRPAYEVGHVPGSAYVDLDKDLASVPGNGGRHPLPDPALFEAAMRRAGVSASRPVVVLDDWGGRSAARCWWLLRWAGHPEVRVLDGGWPAWLASGGAVETGNSEVQPGDFTVAPGGLPTVTGGDLDTEKLVIIDVRAPERFRGEVEPIDPVPGHIPGAVNVPTDANLADDGKFLAPDELAVRYAALGVRPGVDVAAYCGSGVTACHAVLALELAGVPASLYPGSWSEWITDPGRPVELGIGRGPIPMV